MKLLFIVAANLLSVVSAAVVFQCNFDNDANGLCGMITDTYQEERTGGVIANSWERGQGKTPTGISQLEEIPTGPSAAFSGLRYLYFESSYRSLADRSANNAIRSPVIAGVSHNNFQMTFQVYSWGFSLGTLSVVFRDSATNQELYRTVVQTPNQQAWQTYSVVVPNTANLNRNFRFSFEAVPTGSYSDYAIDDIVFNADLQQCIVNSDCSGVFTRCNNFQCVCLDNTYEPLSGTGKTLQCVVIARCANTVCNSNAQCTDTANGPVCSCVTGYRPIAGTSGVNTRCELIPTCANTQCNANSNCVQISVGVVTCNCNSGYERRAGTTGVGTVCDNINECNLGLCHSTALCTDTIGSYNCFCAAGYQPVNAGAVQSAVVCQDINECLNTNPCPSPKLCQNSIGSYSCVCPSTHNLHTDGNCYLNGGWSVWYDEGRCTAKCGGGTRIELRLCNNPAPQLPGGLTCPGSSTRNVTCNTQDCNLGCPIDKTCDCKDVFQYSTTNAPTTDLTAFVGITPGDAQIAESWVAMWNRDFFDEQMKAARCNVNQLQMLINNITVYTNQLANYDRDYNTAKERMREIIDCNQNVEIESSLFDLYDFLFDRCICMKKFAQDLAMKRMALQQKLDKCKSQDWYDSWYDAVTYYTT